jgi:hypothetical protein
MNIYGQPYTNDPIKLTDDELHQLPTIIFQFQGQVPSNHDVYLQDTLAIFDHLAISIDKDHPYDVLLIVPPLHYMEYQDDIDMYISGIYFDEPDGSNNVLGANIMMQHDIYFDIENSRIGFAESDCNYTQVITPYVDKTTSATAEKTIVTPNIDSVKEDYTISMLRVRTTKSNDSIGPWQNSITITSFTFLICAALVIGMLLYGYNRNKVIATLERTHFVRSPPRRGRRRQLQQPQQQEQPQLLQRRTSRIVHRSTSHDSADFILLNNNNKSNNNNINTNAVVVAMTNLISSSSSSFYQGQQQQQRTRRLSYSDDEDHNNNGSTMMISSDSSTLSENDYDTTTVTTSIKKEFRRGVLLRSRSHQVPT